MVLAGPTCVDPFEAYLVEITSDGEPKAHAHTDRPRKGNRYRAVSALGALPQGYISRVEAKAACEDAGKRLCTKREWQRACRGKGGARYPYGHSGKREACNTGKKHLLTELFKKPTGGLKYDEHFNSPELNATEGYLAPGGAYSGCVNEVGTYDMVGNLHEWVSDTVNDELMAALEQEDVPRRDQPWQVGNGVFMGGFYSTTSEHGPGCTFVTVAHEPTYHDYSTGFRCCKTAVLPKPEKKKTIAKPGSNKAAAPTASASASASTSTSTPPATPAAPAAQ
jgi:formylglycine-generating enzyme required for sulfatase activity